MKRTSEIKGWFKNLIKKFKAYIKHLIFPLYLFPVKLFTYSLYYIVKFIIGLILAFIGLIIDTIIFPFKSLKNFLKSIVIFGIILYLLISLFVITDYLTKQYDYVGKFLCSFGTRNKLVNSVVRVVGENSEGSGFFIAPNQVLTNFHVIDGEPSPKVIFPDGNFTTPTNLLGNKDADLAVLFTKNNYLNLVLPLNDKLSIFNDEPLIATGYALGTTIAGNATVLRGNFVSFRTQHNSPTGYVQTSISLVSGMSGGPLTDQCGKVIGINTMGLAGLSMFINGNDAKSLVPQFNNKDIAKVNVDPSKSPQDAVIAFYTYLKARRMQDGFNLLSTRYLTNTNYTEWTNRFTNILDVSVIKTDPYQNTKDTVHIKFSTKNWDNNDVTYHYYEGTWQTVKENGIYKMEKASIEEGNNPDWNWFYN